jgi:serine protease Do
MSQLIRLILRSRCLFFWVTLLVFSTAQRANACQSNAKPDSVPFSEVLLKAQQMSVRIFDDQGLGSGVLIRQQGQVYTVLTNAHVIADHPEYTILTADGQAYPGQSLNPVPAAGDDIALVQFTSPRQYAIAQLSAPDTIQTGECVYAVGFPSWRLLSPTRLEETRSEGFQSFQLTTGTIGMLLDKPLNQGYQLGYTNEVVAGMSGGAVLNRQGQLVGINGMLKYPLQGIFAFTFADGTSPSEELFRSMEPLSWAIPLTTIRRTLDEQESYQGLNQGLNNR